jgi:hypothetical protein
MARCLVVGSMAASTAYQAALAELAAEGAAVRAEMADRIIDGGAPLWLFLRRLRRPGLPHALAQPLRSTTPPLRAPCLHSAPPSNARSSPPLPRLSPAASRLGRQSKFDSLARTSTAPCRSQASSILAASPTRCAS